MYTIVAEFQNVLLKSKDFLFPYVLQFIIYQNVIITAPINLIKICYTRTSLEWQSSTSIVLIEKQTQFVNLSVYNAIKSRI